MTNRNNSIDIAKGSLILCVILGHLLLGTIEGNPIRYVIYSFHMPVFMFISGYMINIDKISRMSFHDILTKYWNRMLKIWLIAYFIFSIYDVLHEPTIKHLCTLIYSPWYHLWYVPTLFCFILICRFLSTIAKREIVLFYPILLMTSMIYITLSQICPISLPRWCDCNYLPYFTIGLLCGNQSPRCPYKPCVLLALSYLPFLLIARTTHTMLSDLLRIIYLLLIILFFIYPSIKRDSLPMSDTLEYIGKNSLNVYLWHMIPIVILKNCISNAIVYYGISFTLLVIYMVIVKIRLNKNYKLNHCH